MSAGASVEIAALGGIVAAAALACTDPVTEAPSASESSAGRVPPGYAASASSTLPPQRVYWDPPSVPRPGSFLGDASEDFVGAFRVAGDRVELFAVDGATLKIAWQVPPPRFCPASRFVTTPTRVYGLTDALQLHVLDTATGKLLATFGDASPHCP